MKFEEVAHLYLGCNLLNTKTGDVDFFDGILFHLEMTCDTPFKHYKPILKKVKVRYPYMPNVFAEYLAEGFDFFGLIESGQAVENQSLEQK